MIQYCGGSIFDSGADVLVNPVNCRGVSGAGLAKEFAARFPKQQSSYEYVCREEWALHPGGLLICSVSDDSLPEKIVYFATKDHWRHPSEIHWIERGLRTLANTDFGEGRVVAIPALGCGLGGLDWGVVRAKIEEILGDRTGMFLVFPPKG